MKQTAVEWYNEQLNLYGDMVFNKEISLSQYHIKKQELLEQAKEMEREQIGYSEEDVIKIVEKSRETGLTAEYLLLTFKQQEQ